MVKRRPVLSLTKLSLHGVQGLSYHICSNISMAVLATGDNVLVSSETTQTMVEEYVERLRDFLWSNVVCHHYQQVFKHFLEGIIIAIETMKVSGQLMEQQQCMLN